MKIKSFKQVIAWEKSHQLALAIYESTRGFPDNEKFCIVSQMRRCSVSIPSNIAEGFKRDGLNDSLRFYNISEGSLEELKYQTLLAKDLKYITEEKYNQLAVLMDEVGKLIYGWKKSQR